MKKNLQKIWKIKKSDISLPCQIQKPYTMKNTVKDVNGNQISEGDNVIFIRHDEGSQLDFGVIERITEKLIFIKGVKRSSKSSRHISKENSRRMICIIN